MSDPLAARFEVLMAEQESASLRYARRYAPTTEDAEDAVQDARLKAWVAFERYDPERPFGVWFRCILQNCLRDQARTSRRRPAVITSPLEEDALEEMQPAALPSAAAEDVALILISLSPEHRQWLGWKMEGLSVREIATRGKVSVGAAHDRLQSAYQAYRVQAERSERAEHGEAWQHIRLETPEAKTREPNPWAGWRLRVYEPPARLIRMVKARTRRRSWRSRVAVFQMGLFEEERHMVEWRRAA